MKRFTLSLALIIACITQCCAQYTIKGVVMDTLNSLPLCYSSVVMLRAADSAIETFGRTNAAGQVELNVPKEGKYIIRASAPGFIDYIDVLQLKNTATSLGTIPMVSKERMLKEFVFTRQLAAIKIKGDTTEYVADSFKTKENATVEDLLKKLPGIQVDKNGKITAQGEEVKKILVDGEEFFSDDPKVVTKGLQAGALDKVQVFDKKSDQAEFTGIDDGEKTKTINLELKGNRKKGYFGKLDGGGGTDGYFQNQGMINAFKGKRQVSAFAIASNTDKAGLGWKDSEKFGGAGSNTEISEDGGMMYSYRTDNEDDIAGWGGKYEGEGLPKTWTGGLHFADKWNEEKQHIGANYRYSLQNLEIGGQTITNNPLYVQVAKKNQFSKGERNALNAVYEWKIDSSTTLKVSVDAGKKKLETYSHFDTHTYDTTGAATNYNDRIIQSTTNSQFINSSALLRKKFAKKGRTFSLDVKENYKESAANGTIVSPVYFKTDHAGDAFDTVTNTDQQKKNNTSSMSFSAKAAYTEPLSKVSFLEFNYQLVLNKSAATNLSYNITNGVASGTLDSTYSSDYRYDITMHKGGINYKYSNKGKSKLSFSVGSDISETKFEQVELLHTSNSLSRPYFNVYPFASVLYALKKQTSVSFYYNGNTRQPTITEVQTLQQNLDPLNQTIGNPNLKQEFTNRVGLHFNDYKALSSQYTWVSLNFRNVADAISTKQTITSQGSRTTYVNVDGNYGGDLYMGGGIKLKKPAVYIGGQLNASVGHTLNFIDNQPNVNNNNSYGISPYINYEKEGKYEINFGPSFSYNDNKSSISKYSNSYWMMDNDLSMSVQLPKKFEVGTSANFYIRQKTAVFATNNNVVRWNAYVSKKFLKNGQLETKLSVFDILNQNLGYSRESQAGIVTENTYNTIRRYGMFNLIWNFTHTPGAEAPVNTNNDD